MRQGTLKIGWAVVVLAFCAYSAYAKPEARLYAAVTVLPATPGWIGDWTVGGRVVHVTAATQIEQSAGPPVVGVYVKVEGTARADGSIDATKVETKLRAGGGVHLDRFRGVVESLPSGPGLIGDWRVGGRVVRVTATTSIKQRHGPVAVGVTVEVEGLPQNDGSLAAVEIETQNGPNNTSEFKGVIESLPSPSRIGDWTVSGRTVRVTEDTQIKDQHGPIAVGAVVEVRGTPLADGSIVATRIEVERQMPGNAGDQVKFFGTIESLPPASSGLVGEWTVSGRKVLVAENTRIRSEDGIEPAVGRVVEVLGRVEANGVVSARMVVVKGVAIGNLTQLFGKIEVLPMNTGFVGDWTVAGRTVHVTATTQIKREYRGVEVGAFVEVRGKLEADDSITAVRVEVKQGATTGGFISLSGPATSVSAASFYGDAAAEGILAAFGENLSTVTATAQQQPLPVELGGVSVLVDGEPAGLFFVSPGQINYELPSGAAPGAAAVVVMSDGAVKAEGVIEIAEVAPSLFTADATGSGAPAGLLLRVAANGAQSYEPLAQSDGTPMTINRRAGDRLFLVLFGTGLRGAPNADGEAGNGVAESVEVTIGGSNVPVLFAGQVVDFVGLDQLNLELPEDFAARGAVQIVVRVRNRAGELFAGNPVRIFIE